MEEKAPAPNLQLQEPLSPESLVPAMDLTWLWIGLAVLALIIVFAVLLRKKRGAAPPDPKTARLAAYNKAIKTFENLQAPTAREAAVQSSLILRRFLADAASDPSLFETHEEFISRQNALKALSPEARDACAQGFIQLARLKYAPRVPAEDPVTVVADSRALLETLNKGFER